MWERERERLEEILGGFAGCAVAYSGGVDSTFLLACARRALGERVAAITVRTLLHEPEEAADARRRAEGLGARHVTLDLDIGSLPAILGNPPDRCYHCKRGVFTSIRERAAGMGLPAVVDASHADDLRERRPGVRALRELGVRSPLAEAGLGKAAIRALSAAMGIEGAGRPSNPCLATRIPYGTALTAERLRRVARSEAAVRDLGFAVVRVRDYEVSARVEVPEADLERAASGPLRSEIVSRLRAAGYRYATLDLLGYRSGSMDEALPAEERAEGSL